MDFGPFQKLGGGMFLTRPLGDSLRENYLPIAAVIRRWGTECFWKGLLRSGSWRRPLSREHCSQSLSRQVTDTNHTPHEHFPFLENLSVKICHLLVPKVSLAATLACIHGTYADEMILWKYNLDSKEIKWLPDSYLICPAFVSLR